MSNEPAASLPTRQLGSSGLRVSTLCLGTMMFGGTTPDDEGRRIIDAARDQGVNFIDTADVYQNGRSEVVTGEAVRAHRQHWVLATKVANPYSAAMNEPMSGGLSRRWIMRACDLSLKRLGTDVIDLYYTHKVDPAVSWRDVVLSFGDLIRAGKIRYWGLSNVRAWHIAEICHLCDAMSVPRPVALQPYYNLLNRQPEVEVLPAARHFGLGVASYSPIARGVLTGKYRASEAPAPDTRAGRADKRMLQNEWRPESLAMTEQLAAHAATKGASLVDFAVAWVLNNKAVTSVIAGPRTYEQWESYAPALGYPWGPDDEALVDGLVAPGHPSTPGHTDPSYPIEGRFPSVAAG
ncbi:MAG: aldo/keto reductase [Pseudomonadota bacterium]